jgi:hypothetical protein
MARNSELLLDQQSALDRDLAASSAPVIHSPNREPERPHVSRTQLVTSQDGIEVYV